MVDFFGEFGGWLGCCFGDLFCFCFQKEDVSGFFFCVAAAYSAFCAAEACCGGVFEVHVLFLQVYCLLGCDKGLLDGVYFGFGNNVLLGGCFLLVGMEKAVGGEVSGL